MYTLLNNRRASKFDLYLPGRLVASLHYVLGPGEVEFVYCEVIDKETPDFGEDHLSVLVSRSVAEARRRRLRIELSCPVVRTRLSGSRAPASLSGPRGN